MEGNNKERPSFISDSSHLSGDKHLRWHRDSSPDGEDSHDSHQRFSEAKDGDEWKKNAGRKYTTTSFYKKDGALEDDKHQKGTFVDAAAMKERVRQNLSKPKHAVTDYYHDTGICQGIAKSGIFDKMTLTVIAFNAIWIAVDTDKNDATLLLDADPIFVLAENFFCLFFSFEWFIRFMAFRKKLDGCKDAWFVFDSFMVVMMVSETWIFTISLLMFSSGGGSSGGNMGVMRLARLMRLSRMARMGKLLRVMPELMIMIKGMLAATRSVCFTLGLLVIIMYIFGIAFVQLTVEIPDLRDKFFYDVPRSMYSLLIYGVFLDNVGHITGKMQDYPHLAVLFYLFVLIGSLTVMNMLIGVLCEVVSAVAATEQEEMLVTYVHEKLSKVMAILDSDGGGTISKKEFCEIIDSTEAVRCLYDVGIDVYALVDLADYIFEDDDAQNQEELELDFAKFMEVVLQLRGTNQATVKDIVDLRKFMRLSMLENYKQTVKVIEKMDEGARLTKEYMQVVKAAFGGNTFDNGAPGEPGASRENSNFGSPAESIASGTVGPFGRKPSDAIEALPKTSNKEQVEGGLPPQLPNLSSTYGQLLSFLPILVDDFRVSSSPDPVGENIALSGDWTPMDGDLFAKQFKIPNEDENSVPEQAESAHTAITIHDVSRSIADVARAQHMGKNAACLAKGLQPIQSITASAASLNNKLSEAMSLDNPDVEALKLHIDRVYDALAKCLDASLAMARKSADRGKGTSCLL